MEGRGRFLERVLVGFCVHFRKVPSYSIRFVLVSLRKVKVQKSQGHRYYLGRLDMHGAFIRWTDPPCTYKWLRISGARPETCLAGAWNDKCFVHKTTWCAVR